MLLRKARRDIKDNEAINFVFADINCSLQVKLNDGSFKYINNDDELVNAFTKALLKFSNAKYCVKSFDTLLVYSRHAIALMFIFLYL